MASRPLGRVLSVVLAAALAISWMLTLGIERDRRRLLQANKEAQASVAALEEERVSLGLELDQARQNLEGQTSELQSMRGELAELQTLLADAHQEITRLQTENTIALDSHAQMRGQLASVQEERDRLEQKLSSIKELRSAIRVARARLRQERWQAYLAKMQEHRLADQRQLAQGNRGFVVRNGLSTLAAAPKLGTKLQVRVLEPQTE